MKKARSNASEQIAKEVFRSTMDMIRREHPDDPEMTKLVGETVIEDSTKVLNFYKAIKTSIERIEEIIKSSKNMKELEKETANLVKSISGLKESGMNDANSDSSVFIRLLREMCKSDATYESNRGTAFKMIPSRNKMAERNILELEEIVETLTELFGEVFKSISADPKSRN